MKVTIDRDGHLTIRPLSPAEDYMLRKWYEDWKACRVTLSVSWIDEQADGGYASHQVNPDPQAPA